MGKVKEEKRRADWRKMNVKKNRKGDVKKRINICDIFDILYILSLK